MGRDNVPNRLDDVHNVLVRHLGVERKREQPLIDFFGDRELLRAVSVAIAVERVPVQGGEIDARTDVAGTQDPSL